LLDQGINLLHGRRSADHLPHYAAITELAVEAGRFLNQALLDDGALEQLPKNTRLHWLFEKPVRLEVANHRTRFVGAAEAGQYDRRRCNARSDSCRSRAKPSMRGITRSVRITSASRFANESRASWPSTAVSGVIRRTKSSETSETAQLRRLRRSAPGLE